LIRGFDYYTNIVFEVFDTNSKNRRSLFGGGRYDNLLEIFGEEPIAAVGFGMGDVTIRDFLETYGLLPEHVSTTDLYIVRVDKKDSKEIDSVVKKLRADGLNVAVDLTDKKVGDQIKTADRQAIPFILVIGEEELKSGKFKLKNLKTREEKEVRIENVAPIIKNR
jgi:histidyl-tRNA synthetase